MLCEPIIINTDSWPDHWRKPLYSALQTWSDLTNRNVIEGDGYTIIFHVYPLLKPTDGFAVHQNGITDITVDDSLKRSRLKTVLIHEIGHAFGLPHNPNGYSIMNPFSSGDRLLENDLEHIERCE